MLRCYPDSSSQICPSLVTLVAVRTMCTDTKTEIDHIPLPHSPKYYLTFDLCFNIRSNYSMRPNVPPSVVPVLHLTQMCAEWFGFCKLFVWSITIMWDCDWRSPNHFRWYFRCQATGGGNIHAQQMHGRHCSRKKLVRFLLNLFLSSLFGPPSSHRNVQCTQSEWIKAKSHSGSTYASEAKIYWFDNFFHFYRPKNPLGNDFAVCNCFCIKNKCLDLRRHFGERFSMWERANKQTTVVSSHHSGVLIF